MRRAILAAALALFAGAAVSACGSTTSTTTVTVTVPVTFTASIPAPATTVPEPASSTYPGPDVVPVEVGPFLAPATTTALGRRVNGIQCDYLRQLAYRTYAHLQVYVNGQPRAIPGGVGMVDAYPGRTGYGPIFTAGACYYWLHTRAADGVIQVESPTARTFTLGDFFAIWNQALSRTRVASASGPVSVLINGHPYHGNPAAIPLREHEQIQLAVGSPVPGFQPIDWTGTPF